MKTKLNSQFSTIFNSLLVWLSFAVALGVHAATYDWKGTSSSNWKTAANWLAGAVPTTNATEVSRLNVGSSGTAATRELVYDASLGTTVYGGNSIRGLVIGNNATGTNRITGGTFSTAGNTTASYSFVDAIGNGSGVGYLILDGGNYISGASGLSLGIGTGTGSLIMSNGTATVTTLTFSGIPATLSLDGGTLAVNNIAFNYTASPLNIIYKFNGGTLKARANSTSFFPVPAPTTGTMPVQSHVRDGGAIIDSAGFNITVGQPLLHSTIAGDAAIDGGLTKKGDGGLTMTGVNTYTGPTIVQAGTLSELLPKSNSVLMVSSGARYVAVTTNFACGIDSVALTNATLEFNYGNWLANQYTNANLTVTNLVLDGVISVNLSGFSFPVTNLTLMTYNAKTGTGSFTLGTLPSGAAATLLDTGSSLVLNITAPSSQSLIWTASVNNNWQTNGAANWNSGTATYLEYPSGLGDTVRFDDTSSGVVNISSTVKPASITVDDTTGYYTFNGSGKGISGATGINKLGASTLNINASNDFTGVVTVNGGTLYVDHPNALGATNGGTIVNGPASTLELEGGVTVTGETVTLYGNGVGGTLGALRGYSGGNNVWAGPVILGENSVRIGTESGGNLTISGPITEGVGNAGIILRPSGSGSVLTLTSTNNFWGGQTSIFGGVGGKVVVGADNVLPVGSLVAVGDAILDLNGHNQTVAGLVQNGGTTANAIIQNGGASPSTLTLDSTVNYTFGGILQDGTAALNVVKNGTNTQNIIGANTYTGSTVVNAGTLGILLPISSSSLTVASNAALSVAVGGSSWAPTSIQIASAILSLNFGTLTGSPTTPLVATTLNVTGSNIVNIAGANIPVGTVTLISYASKTGSGTFSLGSLPPGMAATISDTGSAIVLNVAASPQTLTWSGGTTGTWNTNSTLDWNNNTVFYKEYTNGYGDFGRFDDTAANFTVGVVSDVRPYSITVNNTTNAYVFNGPAAIRGFSGLTKSGTNLLTLTGVNYYTGGTIINAGTVCFTNGALGSNGNIVVSSAATLRWNDGAAEDLSSRLRINVAGNFNSPATLDVGTNNVVFNSGINHDSTGGGISNVLAKAGSGTLTFANGTNTFGYFVKFNAGTVEVHPDAVIIVDGNGNSANAALTIDNSTLLVNGGSVVIADRMAVGAASSTGLVNMVSGYLTTGYGSTTTNRGLRLAGGSAGFPVDNSCGVFNLDGGTLIADHIFQGGGTNNTSIFNFNGGMLMPSDNPLAGAFLTSLTHAYVKSAAAKINTGTNDLTIDQALEHDSAVITDGGLTKLGSGKLTLTGANNYNGSTVVSNGTLWVSQAIGTNSVLVCSGATLGSTGTISGPVTIHSGGVLHPGATTALSEMLTINSSLSLAGTVYIQIGKVGLNGANDAVGGITDINYGGALIVTNADNSALAAGDVFTLFAASGTKTGNFSSVTVLPNSLNLTGVFNPTTGQLTLASGTPPTLSVTNNGGGSLQFSWTGSGILQVQTNSLSTGLGTNWMDYPGGGVSPVNVTVDPANGSVFFRVKQ